MERLHLIKTHAIPQVGNNWCIIFNTLNFWKAKNVVEPVTSTTKLSLEAMLWKTLPSSIVIHRVESMNYWLRKCFSILSSQLRHLKNKEAPENWPGRTISIWCLNKTIRIKIAQRIEKRFQYVGKDSVMERFNWTLVVNY